MLFEAARLRRNAATNIVDACAASSKLVVDYELKQLWSRAPSNRSSAAGGPAAQPEQLPVSRGPLLAHALLSAMGSRMMLVAHIDFEHSNLGDSGLSCFCDRLVLNQLPRLRVLKLNNAGLGTSTHSRASMNADEELARLEELDDVLGLGCSDMNAYYSAAKRDDEESVGVTTLGRAMREGFLPHLQELEMQYNRVQPGGLASIIRGLRIAPSSNTPSTRIWSLKLGGASVLAPGDVAHTYLLLDALHLAEDGVFATKPGTPVPSMPEMSWPQISLPWPPYETVQKHARVSASPNLSRHVTWMSGNMRRDAKNIGRPIELKISFGPVPGPYDEEEKTDLKTRRGASAQPGA